MAHLRNCVLCGKIYDYCPRCDETKPAFHLKYCSENCNDIALILNKYAFKHLTKEEAAMALIKKNLEMDKYSEHNQNYIKGILEAMKSPEPAPVTSFFHIVVEEPEPEVEEPKAEAEVEVEAEEPEEEKPLARVRRAYGRKK